MSAWVRSVADIVPLAELLVVLIVAGIGGVFVRKYGINQAKDRLIDTLQKTVDGLQAEVGSLTRQLGEEKLKVQHLEQRLASEKELHASEIHRLHAEFDASQARTTAEVVKYRNQVSVLVEILRKEGGAAAAADVIGQIMAKEDEQDRLAHTSAMGATA